MSNNNRNGAVSREEAAHNNKNRPARVPFSQGAKLTVPDTYKKEGFHQHWFVDEPGELESAQAAWYEFVRDDQGNKIKTPAGAGNYHYLMEIDQKTYDEDMKQQQDMITSTTKDATKIKKGEYSPEGEDSALTRRL